MVTGISISSTIFAQLNHVFKSPSYHPSQQRMGSCDLDPVYYTVHVVDWPLGPQKSAPKWHLDWFSHFGTAHPRDSHCFSMGRTTRKIAPSRGGSQAHLTNGSRT